MIIAGAPSTQIGDFVVQQVGDWLFQPAHRDEATVESEKQVEVLAMCGGFPELGQAITCDFGSPDFLNAPGK